MIDVSRYPLPDLERPTRAVRKIGLGVMGLAEMLAALGIPYDSATALRLGGRLMGVIRAGGPATPPMLLASQRCPFRLYEQSRYLAGRDRAAA